MSNAKDKTLLTQTRDYYKPFAYPWAYEAFMQSEQMHWLWTEVPMVEDVKDWRNRLTESERDFLTKVFRFFTQGDIDVSAAYDPMYAEVFEKRSSAFFAKGLVFNKFTGSRGKSGSNDANAEYLAQIRRAMDEQNVAYQFAELGKVDAGGGGTIAYIMANYGMEVIDSGVAVLCMHAPWEITSKADVYEAYKGYKAFIREM